MVRKFTALMALLLALGFAASPVAAQDIDSSELEEFGLVSGYVRMYMNSDTSSPLLGVMVGGFEFDEADNAEGAFEEFSCGFASGFMGLDATDCDSLSEGGVNVADVDGIGDQAMEFTGSADVGGETPITMMMVQDENYIFTVINLGDDTEGSADDFAKFLVDAEPSDAAVEFSDDGTSTGGFFDMLPTADDELVANMSPMMDMDMIGSLTGTPAS